MKKKFLSSFFIMIFIFPIGLIAQKIIVKGSGILLPGYNSIGVYDVGVEYVINKNITAQLSYSQAFNDGEIGIKRRIWTPHLRYYFKENRSLKSPYISWLIQNNKTNKWSDAIENNNVVYRQKQYKKWGTGIMMGWQLPIWNRLGADFHIGYMGYYGKEYKTENITTVWKYTESFEVNFRPIVGANLYFAFGKLTEENANLKKKKRKKEKNSQF